MEKIASFTIDHLKLLPGVYVSRKDKVGQQVITTFDIRMTRPNFEPVLNTAEVHTIEHLGATFLRNDSEFKDKTIYFGPMALVSGLPAPPGFFLCASSAGGPSGQGRSQRKGRTICKITCYKLFLV